MKIIKERPIISCSECPHLQVTYGYHYIHYSCLLESGLSLPIEEAIPSWCPLEDYKEADHETPI